MVNYEQSQIPMVQNQNFPGSMPPDPRSLPHALHMDTYLPPPPIPHQSLGDKKEAVISVLVHPQTANPIFLLKKKITETSKKYTTQTIITTATTAEKKNSSFKYLT